MLVGTRIQDTGHARLARGDVRRHGGGLLGLRDGYTGDSTEKSTRGSMELGTSIEPNNYMY